jgi:poly-gamma-glutamate capsule biosynthesis protein CapA/YwtB (metallophosphatase superfamily)
LIEQHQVAGELDEQVLAERSHRADRAPGNRLVLVYPHQGRERRLETGDGAAGQRALERARRAKDRVAFGHG